MKRRHINLTTKLASALLALGDIPYEDAKQMTAEQIVSLYELDHGILHGIEPNDAFWNLTPRLIKPHREKSKRDTSIVAKTRRIEKEPEKWRELTKPKKSRPRPKRRYRWPSRPLRSASHWPKGREFGSG